MALVTIENTREHDITVSAVREEGVVQVTIPGARQNPLDKNELINGRAEVEEALLEAAGRGSQVVRHYFEEGWLRPVKPATPKKAAKE